MTTATRRQEPATMHVLRCSCCRRVLAHVRLTPGSVVEIKCKHCHEVTAIRAGS